MFSGFRFHFFTGVKIYRQLPNLKAVFIGYFMCHATMWLYHLLLCLLLLMVVTERYLRLALIWGHLRTVDRLLVAAHVDVLRGFELILSLPRMDDAVCLDVCFLAG